MFIFRKKKLVALGKWPLFVLGILAPTFTLNASNTPQKNIVDFGETIIEGEGHNPYSSYLFAKQKASTSHMSYWRPDWQKKIKKARDKLK